MKIQIKTVYCIGFLGGFVFKNEPSNLLKYRQGCPKCHESHLEKRVCEALLGRGIIFEQYKRFKWLGQQSLDFFIPEKNIAIECQGIQHFQPVEHFGGIEMFKKQIKNDLKKKELCQSNNINLVYFTDTDYTNDGKTITTIKELLKLF